MPAQQPGRDSAAAVYLLFTMRLSGSLLLLYRAICPACLPVLPHMCMLLFSSDSIQCTWPGFHCIARQCGSAVQSWWWRWKPTCWAGLAGSWGVDSLARLKLCCQSGCCSSPSLHCISCQQRQGAHERLLSVTSTLVTTSSRLPTSGTSEVCGCSCGALQPEGQVLPGEYVWSAQPCQA